MGRFTIVFGLLVDLALIENVAFAHETVDLRHIAVRWPAKFAVTGSKTEPTWVEHVSLKRDNDRFVLEGGGSMEEIKQFRWLK